MYNNNAIFIGPTNYNLQFYDVILNQLPKTKKSQFFWLRSFLLFISVGTDLNCDQGFKRVFKIFCKADVVNIGFERTLHLE